MYCLVSGQQKFTVTQTKDLCLPPQTLHLNCGCLSALSNTEIIEHIPNYVKVTKVLTSLFSFKFTNKFSGIGINTSGGGGRKNSILVTFKNTSNFPQFYLPTTTPLEKRIQYQCVNPFKHHYVDFFFSHRETLTLLDQQSTGVKDNQDY